MSHSHGIASRFKIAGSEIEVARVHKIVPSIGGGNYHDFGNDWWMNGRSPDSFKFLTLDSLYDEAYFGSEGTSHPTTSRANEIYDYMQLMFRSVLGREFRSVLELGTGGGEITDAFRGHNIDYAAVEGTSGGYKTLLQKGHPAERVYKYDLKFMPYLGRRFDICMSTEVFEHVEPLFASRIVEDCIQHSDLVWFSSADRNRRAHYHHMNELPIEAWDNLFAAMGYGYQVALNRLHDRATRLYIADHLGGQLEHAALSTT